MAFEHPELQRSAQYLDKTKPEAGIERAPDVMKASITQSWTRSPSKYTADTLFTYDPLSQNEIRLLCVSKEENAEEGIVCDFIATKLDNLVCPYMAVSYCWGDPKPEHKIVHTDGRGVLVPHSAFNLIKNLTKYYGDLVLWVDALCINQDLVEEKNQQVPLMSRIYGKASKVLVWLGEESDNSALATKCLTRIVSTWTKNAATSEKEGVYPQSYDITTEEASAVSKLLDRPWFSRTWIIQEVTVPDNVFLQVGSWTASWSILPTARAIILTDPQLKLSNFYVRMPDQRVRGPTALWTLRVLAHIKRDMAQDSSGQQFSTWAPASLIMNTLGFKATRPVDRVYGFVGILPPHATTQAITVNYNLIPEEVFGEFTLAELHCGQVSHMLLGQAGILRGFSKPWPSWIPNLAPEMPYAVFSIMSHYQACGNSVFQGISVPNSRDVKGSIALKVILLDKVAGLPNVKKERMGFPEAPKDCFWWLFALMQDLHPTFRYLPTGEDVPEAVWRTLCANFDTNGPAEKHLEQNFMAWFEEICYEKGAKRESQSDAWHKYRDAISQAGFGMLRIPFTTQRGYIGLADHGIQAGDEICIIEGAWVPYIIRPAPVGDGSGAVRHQLVCESYVHGLMNGEGLKQGTWQQIEIC